MKRLLIGKLIFLALTLGFLLAPVLSLAQDAQPGTTGYHLLVTCSDSKSQTTTTGGTIKECNFSDFVKQINVIITFLFYISVMLATIAFIYCGFLFLTAGGDAGKAKQAREIITKVVIGFIWIFAAFLIVKFITSAFGLNSSITLLS